MSLRSGSLWSGTRIGYLVPKQNVPVCKMHVEKIGLVEGDVFSQKVAIEKTSRRLSVLYKSDL